MSKDSLNGTVTMSLPTKHSAEQEQASIKIQRWYRKNSLTKPKISQEHNDNIVSSRRPSSSNVTPRVNSNNSKPGSRRPSFSSVTPKTSRSPVQLTSQDNVNLNGKPNSRRPSFPSVTPKISRSPIQSPRVDTSINHVNLSRQSSRRSSTSSIARKPLPSPRV